MLSARRDYRREYAHELGPLSVQPATARPDRPARCPRSATARGGSAAACGSARRTTSRCEALNRAVDLGVTLIDTALAYGDGHSEELVGRVVRERDEQIVVATKIPPKNRVWPAPDGIDPDDAFPADYVRGCTERSLRNLGLDTIDVQQFHVWSDDWVGRGSWLEGIEALKAEGKIRAFGVSINDHQPANALKLIESGAVDTVQVIYNVFDQSPEDELLDACAEHGIGVLARVPFDEGALTGAIGPDTEFPDGDFRNHYFRDDRKQQVADHVQAILDDLGDRARAAARGRAPLRALAPGRVGRDPGHADGAQRRAQRRGRRRPRAAGRAGGGAQAPPLGPQLLPLRSARRHRPAALARDPAVARRVVVLGLGLGRTRLRGRLAPGRGPRRGRRGRTPTRRPRRPPRPPGRGRPP